MNKQSANKHNFIIYIKIVINITQDLEIFQGDFSLQLERTGMKSVGRVVEFLSVMTVFQVK